MVALASWIFSPLTTTVPPLVHLTMLEQTSFEPPQPAIASASAKHPSSARREIEEWITNPIVTALPEL